MNFNKSEKLCSKKDIDKLFEVGQTHFVYPFKTVFIINAITLNEKTNQIVIIVPKKKIKKAVERNRIKRCAREAYRLNKQEFLLTATNSNKYFQIAIIYIADKVESYSTIESSINSIIKYLNNKLLNSVN